ncbi:galectin-3-binding protein A-like [Gadus chalcogrammus]|uniref:galectin-3-binding protein A-like n=1 Tax=Gadus chalcogrammus TaxID=1042646 RepID=UPI0024C48ECD|nr:galectin-3-binding protein A-like [Gadus chalcogrammus]
MPRSNDAPAQSTLILHQLSCTIRLESITYRLKHLSVANMQKHGTMLSALWILLLHVSPLRSMKFNLLFESPLQLQPQPEGGAAAPSAHPLPASLPKGGLKTGHLGQVKVYPHLVGGAVCHNDWDPPAWTVCHQLHSQGDIFAPTGKAFNEENYGNSLPENCRRYMVWNFQNLTTSRAWSSVSAKLLETLLSHSDLVVPDETFVLGALEDWISKVNPTSCKKQQAALLTLVRFPMIPATDLYKLQFTSAFLVTHKALYQEKLLKGFAAHLLPFGILKNSSTFKSNDRDYQPRIYTGSPWSVAYGNSSRPWTSQTHITPVHTSAILEEKKVHWQLDLFNNHSDCSDSGVRCDSLPAARMTMATYNFQYQEIFRYCNRLLLSCQGRFIHVMDFKDNLACVSCMQRTPATYPCAGGRYDYLFVVRPENI